MTPIWLQISWLVLLTALLLTKRRCIGWPERYVTQLLHIEPYSYLAVEEQWRRCGPSFDISSQTSFLKNLRFLGFTLLNIPLYAGHHVCGRSRSLSIFSHKVCRACKVILARAGGVTHWLVTPDDDGKPMTVCWGQNANNGV